MSPFPGRRLRTLVPALLAVALLAGGCTGLAGGGPRASAGSLAPRVDLSGRTYVVGSKNFDEQQILCQISIAALEVK